MSQHLSALQLDELAAGLAEVPAHLASCPECTGRLEALRKEQSAFLSRPEAKRQLEQLAPAPRRTFLRVLAIAVPLAAGLALFLAWPSAPVEDRLKGAPTVLLLDEGGNSVTHAPPGSKLTLAVGSAGRRTVEVFAVDEGGKRELLYSGEVAAGARVPLTQLEVTPGDVTVTAVFDHEVSVSVRLAVP